MYSPVISEHGCLKSVPVPATQAISKSQKGKQGLNFQKSGFIHVSHALPYVLIIFPVGKAMPTRYGVEVLIL